MFSDLPLDPNERVEKQRQQERRELVRLQELLKKRPASEAQTAWQTAREFSAAFCLFACGALAIALFVLLARDGAAVIAAIIPSLASANATIEFNMTVVNGSAVG